MVSIARVSVLGPDRVGFVAAIADYLFSAGVSLGDTTFAALGSGAEFVALCDLPDGITPDTIQAGLRQLPELGGRGDPSGALCLRSELWTCWKRDTPDHHQRRGPIGTSRQALRGLQTV